MPHGAGSCANFGANVNLPEVLERLDVPLWMKDIQAFAFSERARRDLVSWLLDPGKRSEREELFRSFQGVEDLPPFHAVPDVAGILDEARKEKVLTGQALRTLGVFLYEYEKLFERMISTLLADLFPDPLPLRVLRRTLMESFLEDGSINERTYPEIRRLREKARKEEQELLARLEALLDRYASRGWVRERFVTQRNGRYVIPVASHVSPPGVVHALSNREATLFVEPFEVVDLQNAWIRTRETLREEEQRILQERSRDVHRALPLLWKIHQVLVRAERVSVLVRYARERGAVWPEDASFWDLQEVRHPVLLVLQETVVPFSLSGNVQGVVISGPNAGGKTAVLKTVGLAALAIRLGIPFPGKRVAGPVFREIWTIGFEDPQNIAFGASSFTGIAREIREVLEHLEPPALVLLDEPFAATDPQEGSALAYAVTRALLDRGAQVWITTHLSPLKILLGWDPRVTQAAMKFDEITGKPLYEVVWGEMGSSHALEILEREGFPPDILEEARRALVAIDEEIGRLREEIHRKAEKARRMLEEAEATLQRARSQAEEIVNRARDQAYARLEKADRTVQKALKALQKELRTREDLERLRKVRRTLREEKQESLAVEEGEAVERPEVGQIYAVRGFGLKGRLVEVRGRRAILDVNGQRMEVALELLRTVPA